MDNTNTSSSTTQRQYRTEEESYQSQISPRILTKKNSIVERYNSYGSSLKSGNKSATIVAIQENREREKRELSQLNDRFASYIERVRFLEAQNKKFQLEIDHLRKEWGSQTHKVKETYEVEIREARRRIDDTAKDRATAELRIKRAEEETLKFKDKCESILAGRDSDREKIETLQKQLVDNEADINLFRRRLIDLEDEQNRYRIESQQLILDIQRITNDLDHETLARVQLENEKQSLEEERNFLIEIHLKEIEELKQTNFSGTTLDPTNFFKHELSNAIRNIREEYEQLNQQQRSELESWYRLKVTQAAQEIQSHQAIERPEKAPAREEIKKLRTLVSDSRQDIATIRQRNGELENRIQELEELTRNERHQKSRTSDERDNEIEELRVRLNALGRDYDELVTTKSSLDSEIAIYRKLLEGEEKREGLKQIVTNMEEQARANFTTTGRGSNETTYPYSQSYQRTSGSQESEDRSSIKRDINDDREGETSHLSPLSNNNTERIPATVHEETIKLQDESFEQGSDYDSSIEDPNERHVSSSKETE